MVLAGIVLSFSGKFGLGRCGAAVEMGRLGVRKATSVEFQGQFGGGFEGYGEVGRAGRLRNAVGFGGLRDSDAVGRSRRMAAPC